MGTPKRFAEVSQYHFLIQRYQKKFPHQPLSEAAMVLREEKEEKPAP